MAASGPPLNTAPFTDDDLHELGSIDKWKDLRRILVPVTNAAFAVTDEIRQALVDDTRARFDTPACDQSKRGALYRVVESGTDDCEKTLKVLLTAGVDPDLPMGMGAWRASHLCGNMALPRAASAVFLCRPDMTALNGNQHTPRAAAGNVEYSMDDGNPGRHYMRQLVRDFIDHGRFESQFPSIAELALRKEWFAVKNLIRRRVVDELEFKAKFHGKTAEEWAQQYGCDQMAAELRYYATGPVCQPFDGLKKAEEEAEKVQCGCATEITEMKNDRALMRKQMDAMKKDCQIKDKTIKELLETVAVLSGCMDSHASEATDELARKRMRLGDHETKEKSDPTSAAAAADNPAV